VGAPLFAPPASGGIWAAAHQRRFFRFFVYSYFFISEGFSGFGFYQFASIFFPPGFLGFVGRFSNF
jgi:hypothetical protein